MSEKLGADDEARHRNRSASRISRRAIFMSLSAAGAVAASVAGGVEIGRNLPRPERAKVPVISEGKEAFDARVLEQHLGVFLPELHAIEGDRDDQSIRRAADAATRHGGGTVLLTRNEYKFGAPVALNGLQNVVFESRTGSVVRCAEPRVKLKAFVGSKEARGADNEPLSTTGASNIVIRGIAFDGGLENGVDLDSAAFYDYDDEGTRVKSGKGAFAREARRYAPSGASEEEPRLAIYRAIEVIGDLDETADTTLAFSNVSVENVRLLGISSLPIYLRGVRGLAAVDDSYAYRCLDIGFTYCANVRFARNHIEYSADNGVSISRGNRNVACSGNIISKSFYFGIHLGGYSGDPGPRSVSCTGNTVVHSGAVGINLYEGPRDITITGNFIADVHRGADGSATEYQGSAILIRGGTGSQIAQNIVIVGNNVVRSHKAGILIDRDAEDVLISGNSFRRVGLPISPSGAAYKSSSSAVNFAIGTAPPQDPEASSVRRVVASANAVFEDRESMLGVKPLVRITSMHGADIRATGNYASFETPRNLGDTAPLPLASDLDAGSTAAGTLAYDAQKVLVVFSDGKVWRTLDGREA
ncbi:MULTISPECIES: right-handed parallel beta-helix repeat-containing protein [unclassified Microbacterium]|uniref:right-handed parallel beta-helix repeat-containing protein n=1 Tax=Microbacterium TaxID=33882 RepID=UPI003BA19F49